MMHLDRWQKELESAIAAALTRAKVLDPGNSMRRLDIGVFPWQGSVELSLLRTADAVKDPTGPSGIADWPLYNFSKCAEGCWPEAVELGKAMQEHWEQDMTSGKSFLQAAAIAARSSAVVAALDTLPRSKDFLVTVFDPDDYNSPNYCA